MGTWETGLYDNDLSLDVRDDYIAKLKSGKTDEEALNEILEEYKEESVDDDEKYDFYIALADTMWKKGRMTEAVKKMALKMIEEDKLSDRWEDKKIRKERAKKLDKIKVKLESPMPARKKISIHKPYVLGWEEKDVYTFQISHEIEGYEKYIGWHVLFYVDRIFLKDWNVPGIDDEAADAYFFLMEEEPKEASDIKKAKNICFYWEKRKFRYKSYILETSKRSRPSTFRYLGKCDGFKAPENESMESDCFFWGMVAERDILWGYEDQLRYENNKLMNVNQEITYDGNEIAKVYRELNFILCSLNQIGSYYADKLEKCRNEYERETNSFIDNSLICSRLAKMRRVLEAGFDLQLGEDGMDDLERICEDIPYWSKPGDYTEDLWID